MVGSAKRYRLWVNPKGEPLYVEWITPHPTQDPIYLERHLGEIREALTHPPVMLGPEWEIRVFSDTKRLAGQ